MSDREKDLAYQRAYREKNREKLRAYSREYQRKYRQRPEVRENDRTRSRLYSQRKQTEARSAVFALYGGDRPHCSCCGETHPEFLTIDHRNGGGNDERKKVGWGNAFYRWLAKQPADHDKYRLLCFNCNCYRRSVYQNPICPHQR